MKKFLDDNFLLESRTAEQLYHEYAKDLPIIDYHNHLPPQDVAENRVFSSLTDAWLEGDHYKWRAMRANGVDERYITGDASAEEKFRKWAETVPYTVRNPLYHWTHLELRRYFGIQDLLDKKSSNAIYVSANARLQQAGARELLEQMRVEVICTTDDPADDLIHHKAYKKQGHALKMLPTFRPDKIYGIDDYSVYRAYLGHLSEKVGFPIVTLDDLLAAAQSRVDYFHEVGGRLSDHGFESLYAIEPSMEQASTVFNLFQEGERISYEQVRLFKMTVLVELSKMYHKKGWTQQFHLGAIRNNNQRAFKDLGPDTGFDSIGDFAQIEGLATVLSHLEEAGGLAKTVVYNLNPSQNETFATMLGNFNDGVVPGKMQFGSGWWFLDQKDGMEKQLNALSNMGLISRFVGMLTDSRSFLSFTRHEYFRRILCNIFGRDVENGELPLDIDWTGKVVQGICYYNAKKYFDFD